MTKVLVTGGAGRLGSKVVKGLTETGYSVRIMSRKVRLPAVYVRSWPPGHLVAYLTWAGQKY